MGHTTVDSNRICKLSFVPDQNVTQAPGSRKPPDLPPAQEDHRSRFYADYHKEAEEYDKEFMKKHDEDLDTTLIFVSFGPCLGVPVLTRS